MDQGGLYFVPEGPLTEILESVGKIFREANKKFKEGGARMKIIEFPVVDNEEYTEMVRTSVEESLESMIDDVLEDAFEQLDEGDTVDEIVDTVVERLDAESHSADQYNQLLQAKLDVEAMLASRATEVGDDDKEEIIENALEAADL